MNYDELDLKANPGAFSTFDQEILVPEVEKLEPDQIYLEVGVDKGKSLSIARMVAQGGVKVYGVDLRDDPEVPYTDFIRGDSVVVARMWSDKNRINVLFIDGDHSYEGCKADINAWYPHMAKDGVMLFHDHDGTSPGVVKAVAEFVANHNVKEYYISPNERCSMARVRL